MFSAEKIPFSVIPNHSRLFLEYVALAPSALRFYQAPPTMEALISRPRQGLAGRRADRGELAAMLKRQNQALQCGAATLERIAELEKPDCLAVVTGQQVGFFTGPLYTAYKALTAIRLADELRLRGVPAVPVFWMDTEDHDLVEVLHVAALGPDDRLWRMDDLLQLFGDPASSLSPVGPLVLPEGVREALARYTDAWPERGWRAELSEGLARAYAPGRALREAFGLALTALFGSHGLILFDPMDPDAKRAARRAFEGAVDGAGAIHSALEKRGSELLAAGFHTQVAAREDTTLLFMTRDRERRALGRDESGFACRGTSMRWTRPELLALAAGNPSVFSPSVLLRPIVQDMIFPTVAYVAGPAEVAYYAQVEVLYRWFDLPMPAIWPRAGFTLMDRSTSALLRRYSLHFEDCLRGSEHLLGKILENSGYSDALATVRELGTLLRTELADLRPKIAAIDYNLAPALDNASRKIQSNIDRLARRCLRLETSRHASADADASRILDVCHPDGTLQERVLGIYPFLARHGPSLLEDLSSLIPKVEYVHQAVELG
jgi:bacillithiol biosynthesis cysteine-adding enzyme BshC